MSEAHRDPAQWVTLPGCKKVLFIVHTEVYGNRLRDVLPLLESDLRVQVSFTVAPHAFNDGAGRLVRRLGGQVLPWSRAVREEFDVALAAGAQGIDQVRAPVILLSHGARHLKLERAVDGVPPGARSIGGLGERYLMRNGEVIPAAVALAHDEERRELAYACPQAVPRAEVVGDPCHDRIAASLPLRNRYRKALGLRDGEKLVLVTSAWGRQSVFGGLDGLLRRLVTELPRREYRVAVLVHPNVWAWHGNWQVQSWLAGCRQAGVTLLPPEQEWRQPLIAADWIVGDYSSVTLYGTMTGAPILLSRYPRESVNPDSPGAALARTVPALSAHHPLADQLAYAAEEYRSEDYKALASGICSEPGAFNRRFRQLLYGILGLGQPARRPETLPLAMPPKLTRVVRG
ncbi:hypothetical protein [Streptomyces sp. NRRL F-5135]|uniref:hypothetical protein n=1 Tax=Streptomyces sp. NRRL F-5135 TaxID=1463858 RepID=UPI0004CAC4BA|nr:hypothetical protein [Streptomyces sp. NRRL F-5135]